jgi:hypothetical protein
MFEVHAASIFSIELHAPPKRLQHCPHPQDVKNQTAELTSTINYEYIHILNTSNAVA